MLSYALVEYGIFAAVMGLILMGSGLMLCFLGLMVHSMFGW